MGKQMKFLILGCNGMAGHIISLYLARQGHTVFGFDRTKSAYINSVSGNALDSTALCELVKSDNYDAVINCIGILNQFAEQNKALASYLNAYLPHFLAEITDGSDTQVIHMSTDCVFSGDKGGYTENDLRDGRTFYDRSKALGELEDNKNITLRNSIVGPDINENGIGLFNWFMKQSGEINGYTKAIWTGQTTLQLAKTMEAAAAERAAGLYNMVPENPITKYELLQLFNKYMRKGSIKITPTDSFVCDKALKRTNFDFSYTIPDYEKMVSDMAAWIFENKDMYPHYHL